MILGSVSDPFISLRRMTKHQDLVNIRKSAHYQTIQSIGASKITNWNEPFNSINTILCNIEATKTNQCVVTLLLFLKKTIARQSTKGIVTPERKLDAV